MRHLAVVFNVTSDNAASAAAARIGGHQWGIGKVERVCRPDSVRRRTGVTIIRLGGRLPGRSSHLPARSGEPPCAARRPRACLFDVAPDGVWRAGPVATSAVSSYLAVSPLPSGPADRPPLGRCAFCSTFRRPGPRGLLRLAVSQHPALWSPDLPPAPALSRRDQRPSDPLHRVFYRTRASHRRLKADRRAPCDLLRCDAHSAMMESDPDRGPDCVATMLPIPLPLGFPKALRGLRQWR